MDTAKKPRSLWLAADFDMASVYSCRIPVSSQNCVLTAPAPGPATVRLTMVRRAVELTGVEYTRTNLYPIIRSIPILVRPPSQVAISAQLLSAYKPNKSNNYQGSLAYREMCHAEGPLTVYLKIPVNHREVFQEILQAIGYWGQADGLTYCTTIYRKVPDLNECARPLLSIKKWLSLGRYFSCVVSEFHDQYVTWDEITPRVNRKEYKFLTLELYVWPMLTIEQHSRYKLLRRCSLI